MARKPRQPTQEERHLWERIAAHATPLHPLRPRMPEPVPAPRKTSAQPAAPQKPAAVNGWPSGPLRIGISAPTRSHASSPAESALTRPGLDRRQHRRLRKGKLAPEARIDLHGMTLATAHQALIGFVLQARAANKKLILVITGKGRGGVNAPGLLPETRRGALRHDVPRWLEMPPLDQIVSGVSQAHDRHGGGGAYYVWLRRNRG